MSRLTDGKKIFQQNRRSEVNHWLLDELKTWLNVWCIQMRY
jgi:hypothetical protein